MLIDFTTLDRRTAYFWMASTIAPRPVAWVSSVSAAGLTNLAPFSFFQMVTPRPPTLMICPLHNGDGSLKDTARNIRDTGEFVVNLVTFPMVQQMNATSFSFDAGTSEFEQVGVESAPSHTDPTLLATTATHANAISRARCANDAASSWVARWQ